MKYVDFMTWLVDSDYQECDWEKDPGIEAYDDYGQEMFTRGYEAGMSEGKTRIPGESPPAITLDDIGKAMILGTASLWQGKLLEYLKQLEERLPKK